MQDPVIPSSSRVRVLSQTFERFSRSRLNGRLGLIADTLVAFGLLQAGLRRHPGPLEGFLALGFGALLFSFVEYAFHRWLFHGSIAAFERGHSHHHEHPQGEDALPFFLPPLGMLVLARMAVLVASTTGLMFAAAFAGGYALYGLSHSQIHARRFRSRAVRRWAGSHHVHHYHPDANFGVTTPLWDIVFGTRFVSGARGGAVS